MDKNRVFTLSQVALHKSKEDCWLIINGRVVDVTKFLEEHPGGEEVLMESAGKDATKEFQDIGHSKTATALLLKHQIGFLQGFQNQPPIDDAVAPPRPTKEMEAYVIKEDPKPNYTAFAEFFVPLLVAGVYFGYRCLTGAVQLSS